MEADDYGSLPADAFARGFYTLYARTLNLDPKKVVARFMSERGVRPTKEELSYYNMPHNRTARQVSSMAEPSSASTVSTIGYVLLLLIIIAGGICWYFNINPATYISEKLRGVEDVQTPAALPGDADSSNSDPASPENPARKTTSMILPMQHIPVVLAAKATDNILIKSKGRDTVLPQAVFFNWRPVENRF
jgi:cytoskeletal protein RodZ